MTSIIAYKDFRKGINDTISADNMQDNELKQAINIDLSVRGGFSTRNGNSKITPVSLGEDCTQIIEWLHKDEERMLAVIDKAVHRVNNDGSTTLLQATTANEVGTFAIQNKFYFGDGNSIWKIEDDVVSLVELTGGEEKAEYKIIMDSFAQKAGTVKVTAGSVVKDIAVTLDETKTSIATNIAAETYTGWTVTRAGHEVTFKATASGSEKVFYDPGPTGAWAVVREINAGIDADNIYNTFKKCTMFLFHVNSMRVFGTGNPDDPTAVYYSEPGDPTFVKSTSIMYPASAEGKVTAMIEFMQSVLVSYTYSWWQWQGTDPEGDDFIGPDTTWVRLPIPYGCVGPKTVVLAPQSFSFLSEEGLHTVSTNLLTQTFIAIEGQDLVKNITSQKVDRIMKDIKNRVMCRLIYYQNKLYLAYNDDENILYNNKILVYDWRTEGFVQYTGWRVIDWARNKSQLVFGSTNYILKSDPTRTADVDIITGADKIINMLVETKAYNLDSDLNSKWLDILNLIYQQSLEDNVVSEMRVISDYKTTIKPVYSSVDLIYGREWGTTWGWNNTIRRQYEIKHTGFNFSVIIENNNLNEPVEIFGIGFQFKPLKSRAERDIVDGLLT